MATGVGDALFVKETHQFRVFHADGNKGPAFLGSIFRLEVPGNALRLENEIVDLVIFNVFLELGIGNGVDLPGDEVVVNEGKDQKSHKEVPEGKMELPAPRVTLGRDTLLQFVE
jgi:hypothetical protein